MTESSSYHHGNLREALLQATVEAVREYGSALVSLRDVARRAGVSHSAPAHHFGDKAGLFTALATQGFEMFGLALEHARAGAPGDAAARLAATGVAYVGFAARHPAHFEVMFEPELLDRDDEMLQRTSAAAYQVLLGACRDAQREGFAAGVDLDVFATGAWSLVHGLSTLWLSGNLQPSDACPDPQSLAGLVLRSLQWKNSGD